VPTTVHPCSTAHCFLTASVPCDPNLATLRILCLPGSSFTWSGKRRLLRKAKAVHVAGQCTWLPRLAALSESPLLCSAECVHSCLHACKLADLPLHASLLAPMCLFESPCPIRICHLCSEPAEACLLSLQKNSCYPFCS